MDIERIFAVIIGIENYSNSKPPHGMKSVDFARADTEEFKKGIRNTARSNTMKDGGPHEC